MGMSYNAGTVVVSADSSLIIQNERGSGTYVNDSTITYDNTTTGYSFFNAGGVNSLSRSGIGNIEYTGSVDFSNATDFVFDIARSDLADSLTIGGDLILDGGEFGDFELAFWGHSGNTFVGDELILIDIMGTRVGQFTGYAEGHRFNDGLFIGELSYMMGDGNDIGIRVLQVPLLGDCNQDGVVDFEDIPAFIEILTNNYSYLSVADINEDELVNFDDIPGFIEILTAG